MTDVTASDVPIAEITSKKSPPRPITGPVLMGDILTIQANRPTLLHLWEQWERQVEGDP